MTYEDSYLRYTAYRDPTSLKRLRLIIKQILLNAGNRSVESTRILDLGCGVGSVILPIASMGYRATGVDVDQSSIEVCNKSNSFSNLAFLVGDGETLRLEDRFDVVISSEVLEHVLHPELLLKTVGCHLADNGVAVLSVPNGYSLWELVVARFIQKSRFASWLYKSPRLYRSLTGSETPFHSRNVSCLHSQFFSFGRVKKLVEANGFRILSTNHLALGVFPEWKAFTFVKKLECKVADYVPHFLAGGWLLAVRKE